MLRSNQKNKNKRNELYVHDEDGNLGGTDSANIITEYLTKMLAPTNQEIKIYPPSKLEKPFTTEEISQAASKLKNGKSAGCDGTQAEYIKYAPIYYRFIVRFPIGLDFLFITFTILLH